jgi:phosphoglycerate-specific signal transduction histidine kinase
MHPSQDGCKDHTATVSNINDQPFSAKAKLDQSKTRLTHDHSTDHTSEEVLTTKRPFLRVSNQVVKEQRQRLQCHCRSDAGGILPRSHQGVKLPKQETDTILNLLGNARYFPTVKQKKQSLGNLSVRRSRHPNLNDSVHESDGGTGQAMTHGYLPDFGAADPRRCCESLLM